MKSVISSVTLPMIAIGGPAMPLTPAETQLPISLLKNLTNLFLNFLEVETSSTFFSSSPVAAAPATVAPVCCCARSASINFCYATMEPSASTICGRIATDIRCSKPPLDAEIAASISSSKQILSRLLSDVFIFYSKSVGMSLKSMFVIIKVIR